MLTYVTEKDLKKKEYIITCSQFKRCLGILLGKQKTEYSKELYSAIFIMSTTKQDKPLASSNKPSQHRTDSASSAGTQTYQTTMDDERFTETVRKAVREAVRDELASILSQLESHESKIMDLEVYQEQNKKDIKRLNSVIQTQHAQLAKLENQVNEQEQYSKRNCLIFLGIPETKEENTTDVVQQIASEKLGINLPPTAVDRSHRLPRRNQGDGDDSRAPSGGGVTTRSAARGIQTSDGTQGRSRSMAAPRPIVVKFTSYQYRQEVIRNRRRLKGSRMAIMEQLTRKNQELLAKAKANSRIKDAWTRDGRIVALIPATGGRFITRGIRHETDLPGD